MSVRNRVRRSHLETPELNITAFMNLMVVLVPFLLISAVFSQLTILELNLPQGETRFDPIVEPHAHLLCLRCGGISDWVDPMMPEMIAKASAEANFVVTGSIFELKGVCEGCRKKGETAPTKAAASE